MHDASGADVEVPDFGIAHLARRKPHGFSRGLERRARTGLPISVEVRRGCERNGVSFSRLVDSEAVHDDEQGRQGVFVHVVVHLEAPLEQGRTDSAVRLGLTYRRGRSDKVGEIVDVERGAADKPPVDIGERKEALNVFRLHGAAV